MPLQDPPVTCWPLVSFLPLQKLMKLASSLSQLLVSCKISSEGYVRLGVSLTSLCSVFLTIGLRGVLDIVGIQCQTVSIAASSPVSPVILILVVLIIVIVPSASAELDVYEPQSHKGYDNDSNSPAEEASS